MTIQRGKISAPEEKLRNVISLISIRLRKSGHNSAVEYELPKLGVAGSNPVVRSFFVV